MLNVLRVGCMWLGPESKSKLFHCISHSEFSDSEILDPLWKRISVSYWATARKKRLMSGMCVTNGWGVQIGTWFIWIGNRAQIYLKWIPQEASYIVPTMGELVMVAYWWGKEILHMLRSNPAYLQERESVCRGKLLQIMHVWETWMSRPDASEMRRWFTHACQQFSYSVVDDLSCMC